MALRILYVVSIGLAFQLALSGGASAKKADPSKMTCDAYLLLDDDEQVATAAFLDGWKHGKQQEEIGEVGVERDVSALIVSCKETPKESLWRRFEKHVPVLKRRVKPIEMKCEDYVGLQPDVQQELFAYSDGYDRGTRTQTDVAGEIDVEQDYLTFVQVCKQAPKESLWAKLKAHFGKKM